jgi:hypothetical protein
VKNRPKGPNPFFVKKFIHSLNRGKSGPDMWAASVIFKLLAKVNNHPMGKNSPNLVTLVRWVVKALDQGDQLIL